MWIKKKNVNILKKFVHEITSGLVQHVFEHFTLNPIPFQNIIETLFRIHLRHTKRFNNVLLLSLSAKLTFKIIHLGVYVLRIDFLKTIK